MLNHPQAAPKYDDLLLQGPILKVDPILYESITPDLIRKCALKTKGAAGPSCLDGDDWRKILGSNIYGSEGVDLRKAISEMTKILCRQELSPDELITIEAILNCRLIPLNKNPGLRPIGIGEVLRRIIGKAVMSILKKDVMEAAGPNQLCAGQQAGCEAAVHSVVETFNDDDNDVEGILQVDAINAFNTINRQVLLHNIKIICPHLATYVVNCYGLPAHLFVYGGKSITSREGTTQGDPTAMGIYALGILPLLIAIKSSVHETDDHLLQVAFADDLTGTGSLRSLRTWWETIVKFGHSIGYYANGEKSWLIVRPELIDEAKNIFTGTSIKVTTEGRRHLGACVGSASFKENYVRSKVQEWVKEINNLAEIANQNHIVHIQPLHMV